MKPAETPGDGQQHVWTFQGPSGRHFSAHAFHSRTNLGEHPRFAAAVPNACSPLRPTRNGLKNKPSGTLATVSGRRGAAELTC